MMAIEITSRFLALVTTVAFTLVLTSGQLAMIPKGRWTFVVLFGLGLTMCTVAGTREGVGTALAQPGWLSAILAAIGISASLLLIAVLIGLDWRLGVTLLGVQISASWLLALGYAVYAGRDDAIVGLATLALALGSASITWRLAQGRPPVGAAAAHGNN
jgi:uncharacterized membrane protein YeiB